MCVKRIVSLLALLTLDQGLNLIGVSPLSILQLSRSNKSVGSVEMGIIFKISLKIDPHFRHLYIDDFCEQRFHLFKDVL
jgi:hypothetical protein